MTRVSFKQNWYQATLGVIPIYTPTSIFPIDDRK